MASNTVSEKDAFSHNTNYAYDLQNRLVSTTDGVNATTSFKYNVTGDPDTVTDARE